MCEQGEGGKITHLLGCYSPSKLNMGTVSMTAGQQSRPQPPASTTRPMHIWGIPVSRSPPPLLSSPLIARQPGARPLCAEGALLAKLLGDRLGHPHKLGELPCTAAPGPALLQSSRSSRWAFVPGLSMLAQKWTFMGLHHNTSR